MKLRIPMLLALLLLACDPGPEPEPDQVAERSPAPAPDREPACDLGSLGCRCPADGVCWAGYRCAYADGYATVCGLETFGAENCDDHGLALAGEPAIVTGSCVAACKTDSDCGGGSMICAPAGDQSVCSWP